MSHSPRFLHPVNGKPQVAEITDVKNGLNATFIDVPGWPREAASAVGRVGNLTLHAAELVRSFRQLSRLHNRACRDIHLVDHLRRWLSHESIATLHK